MKPLLSGLGILLVAGALIVVLGQIVIWLWEIHWYIGLAFAVLIVAGVLADDLRPTVTKERTTE